MCARRVYGVAARTQQGYPLDMGPGDKFEMSEKRPRSGRACGRAFVSQSTLYYTVTTYTVTRLLDRSRLARGGLGRIGGVASQCSSQGEGGGGRPSISKGRDTRLRKCLANWRVLDEEDQEIPRNTKPFGVRHSSQLRPKFLGVKTLARLLQVYQPRSTGLLHPFHGRGREQDQSYTVYSGIFTICDAQ